MIFFLHFTLLSHFQCFFVIIYCWWFSQFQRIHCLLVVQTSLLASTLTRLCLPVLVAGYVLPVIVFHLCRKQSLILRVSWKKKRENKTVEIIKGQSQVLPVIVRRLCITRDYWYYVHLLYVVWIIYS